MGEEPKRDSQKTVGTLEANSTPPGSQSRNSHRPSQVLPLEPRGLRRAKAAAYITVSPNKFDEMVRDGRMPPPKIIDRLRVWDRREIDVSFEALPIDGSPEANPWDEIYDA